MKPIRDLRQSLPAKIAAFLLFFTAAAAATAGAAAVTLLSLGYGTAASFQEDISGQQAMEQMMEQAVRYALTENEDYDYGAYSAEYLLERAVGFSAQVFDQNGEPVGSWGVVPAGERTLARTVGQVSLLGERFTVYGYLSDFLPAGSEFALRFVLYNLLHSLHFGLTLALTAFLLALALTALVFLFCAAGHRAGRAGISLNWQDRIPLDLYLCLAGLLACLIPVPYLAYYGGMLALNITILCLTVGAEAVLVLALLLTLATRFKKGRWWRNTVCWRLARWCKKLWTRFCGGFMELVRILPMTWRAILTVLAVLSAQSVLTVFIFAFYDGFFFLPVVAAMDIALLVGAAWMTRQLQMIRDMGSALAAGDLEAHLDTEKMYFDVKRHAEDLNAIGVGMNKAVEQRLKSERLKTELITNVSHDIKTPLTSIVNYVDLLKKEELPPSAQEYLTVLDRQSHRLKKLTEDLVEASKASTGNVTVNLEPIVVNEIIHQAVGDYDEKLAAGGLEVIVNTYEGTLMALADGRLLWRVLDNLLGNVCKYAMAGTRVYVDLAARDGKVVLSMKNISREALNVSADELMERFVRGDASRHTEGSGLGLNIARSLMELMGGSFALHVDGDLFKAELTLRA